MKIVICLFLAAAAIGTILFAKQHSAKTKSWASEPQQFLGIALGKPVSESLPLCQNVDDHRRCYDAGYSTAENVTDAFGLVSVELKRDLVQGIMVRISSQNADLAYKDLVERYGRPTDHTSDQTASWVGKHISINFLRPSDTDHPGLITVWDSDVHDDPAPAHKNTF